MCAVCCGKLWPRTRENWLPEKLPTVFYRRWTQGWWGKKCPSFFMFLTAQIIILLICRFFLTVPTRLHFTVISHFTSCFSSWRGCAVGGKWIRLFIKKVEKSVDSCDNYWWKMGHFLVSLSVLQFFSFIFHFCLKRKRLKFLVCGCKNISIRWMNI